jgi:lipid-binding SYLF domain-containing protein
MACTVKRSICVIAAGLLFGAGCATGDPAASAARDSTDARNLVEKARMTVEGMSTDPQIGPDVRALMARAKGVFIAPEVLRGAFIFGASGGNGVFMARKPDGQGWNGPAFYTLGDVSFGLQAGGDSSEVLLLAMTDRGVSAMLANSVKLGAGVGVAAGPVGGGASAATANISGDILSYSRSKGVYAGVALDGAVIATREKWNDAYYGRDVTPPDILVRGSAQNREAAPLIQALSKATPAK